MTRHIIDLQNSVQTTADFAAAFLTGTAQSDSLIVENAAYLRTQGLGAAGALLDNTHAWKVQVEGSIHSEKFVALQLLAGNQDTSHITVGANGQIVGGFTGVQALSSIAIKNKGVIEGVESAIEVETTAGNRLNNEGSISGETSFGSFGADSIDRIRNSGEMTGSLVLGGGDDRIVNTGGIAGDPVQSVFNLGEGDDTLINRGTIKLQVTDVHGSNVIQNGGLIDSYVVLGAGDDVFTNFVKTPSGIAHGTVTAEVDLGAGDDRFKGGADIEIYRDGSGADVANFGGGNDIYNALGVVSVDGVDRIDGGKGIDTYDASTDVDGVFINLDTVAHELPFGSGHATINAGTALGSAVAGAKFDRIKSFENAFGGLERDIIYGSAKANVIDGRDDMDDLYGMSGKDHLVGGGSLDHLTGGAGSDLLTGGEGTDMFVFNSVRDSGTRAATRDVITDFEDGDNIVLTRIDAIKGTSTDDAFDFIGTNAAFTGQAGELRAYWTASGQVIEGDVDGDAIADFSIGLGAGTNILLKTSDFEL